MNDRVEIVTTTGLRRIRAWIHLWFCAWKVSRKYHFRLLLPWRGYRPFWHVWHAGHMAYAITYLDYLDRIVEINTEKPATEREVRFRLMKPVQAPMTKEQVAELMADGWSRLPSELHDAVSKAHAQECTECQWTCYREYFPTDVGYIPDWILEGREPTKFEKEYIIGH